MAHTVGHSALHMSTRGNITPPMASESPVSEADKLALCPLVRHPVAPTTMSSAAAFTAPLKKHGKPLSPHPTATEPQSAPALPWQPWSTILHLGSAFPSQGERFLTQDKAEENMSCRPVFSGKKHRPEAHISHKAHDLCCWTQVRFQVASVKQPHWWSPRALTHPGRTPSSPQRPFSLRASLVGSPQCLCPPWPGVSPCPWECRAHVISSKSRQLWPPAKE